MKTYIIIGFLLLVGCQSPQEIRQKELERQDKFDLDMDNISKKLPNGCSFDYMGEVNIPDKSFPNPIFVADCDGKQVETTIITNPNQSGKTVVEKNIIVIKIDKDTGEVIK